MKAAWLGAILASWALTLSAQDSDRPFMGVSGSPLDADEAEARGLPGGGRLDTVYPDGPAFAAGLRRGDVILALDGKPVLAFMQMAAQLRKKKPGDEATFQILRGAEKKEIKVKLGSYKEIMAMKGSPAPPLLVDEWVGEPQPLDKLKGKVVVLVFWSIKSETWKLLEPDFQQLAKDLAGKVSFVGVHVANDRFEEQTPDAVKGELKEKPFAGPVALASGEWEMDTQARKGIPMVQDDYRFQALPTIVVIDKDGKIAFKEEGADLYVSDVKKAIQDLMK